MLSDKRSGKGQVVEEVGRVMLYILSLSTLVMSCPQP